MDYSADPPRELHIALEPGVPLQKQLEKRLSRANGCCSRPHISLERLAQVESEVAAWQVTIDALLAAPEHAERETLLRQHPLLRAAKPKQKPVHAAKSKDAKIERPYRRIYLALRPRDLGGQEWKWQRRDHLQTCFTSRHVAPCQRLSGGARHSVPKRRGESLDPVTLHDACVLAAHFSKAPCPAVVEVHGDRREVREEV